MPTPPSAPSAPRVICIDGPAGVGKSTVARAIAKRLGFLYVDSGALYRIATWKALQNHIDTSDTAAMTAFADSFDIQFGIRDGALTQSVDGIEPGLALRTPEVNAHVSPVAAVPAVRAKVTALLRSLPSLAPLSVEGRDIGSVVYPNSPARFYLDADPNERTRRRLREDVARGFMTEADADKVRASLLERDKIDSSRKTAPLRIPEGAIVIDTTPLSIDQVVDAVIAALPTSWIAHTSNADV